MATSEFRNKNLVRPRKRGKARRQRLAAQRKRLLGLGVPETVIKGLNVAEVRTLLKRPVKTAKRYAPAE